MSEAKTVIAIKIGQIWRAVYQRDKRAERDKIVISVGELVITLRSFPEGRGARSTFADRKRFNGRSGGYRLIKDVP